MIAPAHKKRLAEILKRTKFCVLIDESTDVSNQSLLCIVVHYFDDEIDRIHDSLWDIVPAYNGDENHKVDAQTIVDKVISTFNSDNVPLNNSFAFCSDTCNLMIGNRSSVATKLMEIIPGIRIVKCSAHIQHLCAQDALKIVSSIYNQIVHQVHNYFAHSSKRQYRFYVLQIKSGVPVLKILKPANTRWLSYFQCMDRILSRWTVLIQYFESECLESDQLAAAKPLLDYLINPMNKLHHLFLHSVYLQLQKANLKLQSQKPNVYVDNSIERKLYLDLLSQYLKNDYISSIKLSEVDPKNCDNFKPLNEITLEKNVVEQLNKVLDENGKIMLKVCQQFLSELCSKLKQKYDNFSVDSIKYVSCFHSKNALNPHYHEGAYENLDVLFYELPLLTNNHDVTLMIQINNEWSGLPSYNIPEYLKEEENADIFWARVKNIINEEGI